MSGLPYIRFYGTDWRSDPRLRLCSPAARGVWIDAISLMMEAEPYGHLVIDGRLMTPAQFSALTATPLKTTREAFAELRQHGVSSETEDGAVFSRRMVRDKAKLDAAKDHGKRGGNPSLKGDGKPPPKTGPLTPPDNLALVKPEARSQKPEATSSVPTGTGATAPLDPKRVVFGQCLDFLAETCRHRKREDLRALLGKWVRDQGAGGVIDAVSAAQREGVLDPVPWIEKRFTAQRATGNGTPPRKLSVAERIAENEARAAAQTR